MISGFFFLNFFTVHTTVYRIYTKWCIKEKATKILKKYLQYLMDFFARKNLGYFESNEKVLY